MFCPQCKAEYRVGFVRCSDCDVELVDQLPEDSPPINLETDHPELVILRTYPAVIDAELAKTVLDSVGIDSMIRSDNEGGQSPGLSFTRGAELLVRADDVAAAEDILAVEGIEGSNLDPPARG